MRLYVKLDPEISKIEIPYRDPYTNYHYIVFLKNKENRENGKNIVLTENNTMEIRQENRYYYGIYYDQGKIFIISQGKKIPLAVDFTHESYDHNFKHEFRSLCSSGIEVETDNLFTTVVLLSLLKYYNKRFSNKQIKYDGSLHAGGYEFILSLNIYIERILEHIKPSLNFQSTHVHISHPRIVTAFSYLAKYSQDIDYYLGYDPEDYYDKDNYLEDINNTDFAEYCCEIFGRYFNGYAEPFLARFTQERYAFITTPYMEPEPYDPAYIDAYEIRAYGNRPTVEFRLLKMVNVETAKRFLLFLDATVEMVEEINKSLSHKELTKKFLKVLEKIAHKDVSKIQLKKLWKDLKRKYPRPPQYLEKRVHNTVFVFKPS